MTTFASEAPERLAVLDADSHLTDVDDLWTKRAPAAYKDQILHVENIDGVRTWVVEGISVGKAGGGSTIDKAGIKHPFQESMVEWDFERAHIGAWDIDTRLEVLDTMGIQHQVLYPNALGLGGQALADVKDPVLRNLCVEIFNDSRAEIQSRTNNRLLPMPILPSWDIDACVREAQRISDMGLRGVNMTSDPQDLGSPDLANRAWDPLWEACADLELPVHFHIGASLTAMNFFGQYFWESQHEYVKPAIGGAMLFIGNARVVINTIFAGVFDRHPKLKMVSVESGIGWVPFILETMDWELPENAPAQAAELDRAPSEYFKTNWHATMWFETGRGHLQELVDKVGEDNIMFETDFPHPTSLWPKPLEHVHDAMATLRPETRRKILAENGNRLYRLG
ncbi:MAG: amidohydrolase family protein, partial [Acidimicrobiales bacterium]|jgi:predicted TIM-barrel fold metal-dependent hydrolase